MKPTAMVIVTLRWLYPRWEGGRARRLAFPDWRLTAAETRGGYKTTPGLGGVCFLSPSYQSSPETSL